MGNNFCIFNPQPDLPPEDQLFRWGVLKKQFAMFGPWPIRFREVIPPQNVGIVTLIEKLFLDGTEKMEPFSNYEVTGTSSPICQIDKDFIAKIMNLDWRERPTAETLLMDDWFTARPGDSGDDEAEYSDVESPGLTEFDHPESRRGASGEPGELDDNSE
jgi:hypothetical protein